MMFSAECRKSIGTIETVSGIFVFHPILLVKDLVFHLCENVHIARVSKGRGSRIRAGIQCRLVVAVTADLGEATGGVMRNALEAICVRLGG